ncbi:glucose 1-dehydrogenase [Sphingomonas immobilis]|nr:glucose 1-dehydrogenase [Sphingomonas sp. CA1-15]
MRPLEDKIALVTGAGRGIGHAIARRLAADGAEVILNYSRAKEGAEALAAEIVADGGKAWTVMGDVADLASIAAMFEVVAARTPAFDILVNNAGRGSNGQPTLETSTPEIYDDLFALNTRGLFFVTQAASPLLRDGGAIINMSSMVTRARMSGLSVYAGTKAAVEAFTRIWAAELARRQITVNSVSPSMVMTDLIRDNMPPDRIEKIARAIPLGRVGEPEDIAATVAFLAGPGARWITGQDFPVSGGT